MVIANEGENFSVGANLMLVLLAAQEGEWDDLNAAVSAFQQANMALKYAPKPVVAAPFGMTLGGGCEIALHAARVQASAELYIGHGGNRRGRDSRRRRLQGALLRLGDAERAFELIGYAKVSTSAEEARHARPVARWRRGFHESGAADRGRQSASARRWRENYAPGVPRQDINVGGEAHIALLKMGAVHGAAGPLHHRVRYGGWRKTGVRFERRTADRRADGFRTVSAGSGARGVFEPVRQAGNAGSACSTC